MLTEISLTVHMLQHVVIVVAGIMVSYPLYRQGRFDAIKRSRSALCGFAAISALVVFWHLPSYWDAAVLSFWTHVFEHVCFFIVGILIGIFIPMLNDNMKVMAAVVGISAHMFYGFALYISTSPIYPLYPVSQQVQLGLLLFAPSPIYLIGYLYFNLTRESRRLEREFSSASAPSHAPKSSAHGKGAGQLVVVLLAVILLASLGVYYVSTFAIISTASYGNSPSVAVIYIEEGPITWQYNPQNITVVIGVNNTVKWVSHSYTEDTVTSANGTFDSGPISPGQTFSYTFSKPGTYRYYCEYHLWMSGSITVRP